MLCVTFHVCISALVKSGGVELGFDCVAVGVGVYCITKGPGSIGLSNGVEFGILLYAVREIMRAK